MCKCSEKTSNYDLMNFQFTKVRDVKTPTRGTSKSAGIDFYVPNDLTRELLVEKNKQENANFFINDDTICMESHSSILIPSGLHVKIPHEYMLMLANKSGVGLKKGLTVCANIIDSDYENEFCFHFINTTKMIQRFKLGEKIVQGIIVPILLPNITEVESLSILYRNSDSQRKLGGFGSTGTI